MNNTSLIDDEYIARHRLVAGNRSSNVAICALWKDLTKVKFIPEYLDKVQVIGNLYTTRGISLLLRGLFRAPSIRHLVLWGPDTQHTGRELFRLWNAGLDSSNKIIGTDVQIDHELPELSVLHLRQSVQLHDWRARRDIASVMDEIGSLEASGPHGQPQAFPEPVPARLDTLPSAMTGWHITSMKVGQAWAQLLAVVMRFGEIKHSQYNILQRELLNVLTIVLEEDPGDFHLPPYLPISQASLDEYSPTILDNVPADDLSYTYGNRLRGYFNRDQIRNMIDQLGAFPYSRRAIATMWDPVSDPERDTPPCLTQIVANVVGGRLYLTYTARSQDIFSAWPQNTFAMRILQAQIAKELNQHLGPITSHTVSAHIYAHDWDLAYDVISRTNDDRGIVFDPQGNFAIRIENGQILVELQDPNSGMVIWQTHGLNSYEIGSEIARLRLASLPSHFMYLGRELQRAEEALKRHENYDQGMA